MRLHGHKKENEALEKFADDSANALVIFLARAICKNARALNYVKKKIQENPDKYKMNFEACLANPYIKCEDSKTIIGMVSAMAFVKHNNTKEIGDLFLKFFPETKKLRIGQTLREFCTSCASIPRGSFDFLNTAAIFFSQINRFSSHSFDCSKDEVASIAINHMIKYTRPIENFSTPPASVKALSKKLASIPFVEAMAKNDFEDTTNYIYNIMHLHGATPALLENAKINGKKWEQLIVTLKDSDLLSGEDGPDGIKDYLFIGRIVASLTDAFAAERSYALELYAENDSLKKKINDLTDSSNSKADDESMKKHIQEQIRTLQTENDKLQIKVSDLQSELQEVNEYINQIELRDEKEEKRLASDVKESADETVENYPDGTILIGGHGRWQKFFHQKYPNVRIIDGNDRNFNKGLFSTQTPLVLVNTLHLSHSCFKRFYPVVKQLGIKVEYVY